MEREEGKTIRKTRKGSPCPFPSVLTFPLAFPPLCAETSRLDGGNLQHVIFVYSSEMI